MSFILGIIASILYREDLEKANNLLWGIIAVVCILHDTVASFYLYYLLFF